MDSNLARWLKVTSLTLIFMSLLNFYLNYRIRVLSERQYLGTYVSGVVGNGGIRVSFRDGYVLVSGDRPIDRKGQKFGFVDLENRMQWASDYPNYTSRVRFDEEGTLLEGVTVGMNPKGFTLQPGESKTVEVEMPSTKE